VKNFRRKSCSNAIRHYFEEYINKKQKKQRKRTSLVEPDEKTHEVIVMDDCIYEVDQFALDQGALGDKVMGAGGGGFFMF
jgi:hypothetical protein